MISLILLVVCSSTGGSPDYWVQGVEVQGNAHAGGAAEGAKGVQSESVIMVPMRIAEGHPEQPPEPKYRPANVHKTGPTLMKITVHKPMFPRLMQMFSDRSKTVPIIVERNVPYPVEREVPVPVKEYVEVPKPYHVPVVLEKKVPVVVEKKVPVKVEMPVEMPYPVEVEVPYEVTVVKKVPYVVEKRVPYHVGVPEYVEVPVPMYESGREENYEETIGFNNETVSVHNQWDARNLNDSFLDNNS